MNERLLKQELADMSDRPEEQNKPHAHYMIIKFYPSILHDENIYIGVIAWDHREIRYRFASDWGRIAEFAQRDVSNVREALGDIEQLLKQAGSGASLEEVVARLRELAGRWVHCVRLTHPRYARTVLDDLWREVSTWVRW